jgi:uncharacterized protein (DUF433 family)
MSTIMNLHLQEDQVERLARAAQSLKRTPADAAVLLLEEALRERDFPWIEFRDSGYGRQAFLQGTRLAVWHVILIARGLDHDLARIAAYFELPEQQIAALLNYATAFPGEIQAAIDDDEAAEAMLETWVPNLEVVRV